MQLLTERLILRDFRQSDWPSVLAYQSDPRYLQYYEWTGRTPEQVQEFVGWFIDHQRQQPRHKFQLAIVLKDSGQLIGNCGIRKPSPEARVADMGYELAPEHWRKGYATEAAHAIIRFGFTQLGLHRIEAECVADNRASAHVLEKIGMKREGHLRQNQYYKDRWWDTLIYGLLESEWHSP